MQPAALSGFVPRPLSSVMLRDYKPVEGFSQGDLGIFLPNWVTDSQYIRSWLRSVIAPATSMRGDGIARAQKSGA
jgi:hypothetical protein